jgi:hypothetical protein
MTHVTGEYMVMFQNVRGTISTEEEAALSAVFNKHGKGEIVDRTENARFLLISNADEAVAEDIRRIPTVRYVVPNQTGGLG